MPWYDSVCLSFGFHSSAFFHMFIPFSKFKRGNKNWCQQTKIFIFKIIKPTCVVLDFGNFLVFTSRHNIIQFGNFNILLSFCFGCHKKINLNLKKKKEMVNQNLNIISRVEKIQPLSKAFEVMPPRVQLHKATLTGAVCCAFKFERFLLL